MKEIYRVIKKNCSGVYNLDDLDKKNTFVIDINDDTNSVNPRSKEMLEKLIKTKYSELEELLGEIDELEAELEDRKILDSEVDEILLDEIESIKNGRGV